jgi:hypothetical protein
MFLLFSPFSSLYIYIYIYYVQGKEASEYGTEDYAREMAATND